MKGKQIEQSHIYSKLQWTTYTKKSTNGKANGT